MEFSQTDYQAARNAADRIKNNADNIMDIFNSLDKTMSELYGDAWQSSGADVTEGRYQELRKNYEVFYSNVIAMKNHIYSVTAANEETDTQVSSDISNI